MAGAESDLSARLAVRTDPKRGAGPGSAHPALAESITYQGARLPAKPAHAARDRLRGRLQTAE